MPSSTAHPSQECPAPWLLLQADFPDSPPMHFFTIQPSRVEGMEEMWLEAHEVGLDTWV